MGRKKLFAGCDPSIPLLCCVCGDKARGNNFSVLSCVSCKSFFRRHGQLQLDKLQCKYDSRCSINKETRAACLPCRLRKCLEVGMDPQMIRCPPVSSRLQQQRSVIFVSTTAHDQLPTPRVNDLLQQHDRSKLSTDQWSLLSNIINSYDEQNLVNRVRTYLTIKSSLPVKLRSKSADTLNLISEPMKCLLPLIERSTDYKQLSDHTRQHLVVRNVFFTGAMNGYLVARETNAFENPDYITACSSLYGYDYMMKCAQDNRRLESNGNLIKLLLFVLIFSSNCSIVLFTGTVDNDSNYKRKTIAIELLNVENIYVTMLWKYMVYLYGYNQAALRFSSMIKSIIDMFHRVEELPMGSLVSTMTHKING